METSFAELRQKEVINVSDGRRLGKVCDVVFEYPQGRVTGIVVPGSRGFRLGKSEQFIELREVKKIGVDVILVEVHAAPPKEKCKNKWCASEATSQQITPYSPQNRRDYGEYE